jgi:hypothetical protein
MHAPSATPAGANLTQYSGSATLTTAADPNQGRPSSTLSLAAVGTVNTADFTKSTLRLSATGDWTDAFGLAGLTLPASSMRFSTTYSPATANWAVTLDAVPSLSPTLASDWTIQPGAPVALAANLDASSPVLALDAGRDNGTASAMRPTSLGASSPLGQDLPAAHGSVVFAPNGGSVGGQTYDAGTWVSMVGTNLALSAAARFSYDPSAHHLVGSGPVGDLTISGTTYHSTTVTADVRPGDVNLSASGHAPFGTADGVWTFSFVDNPGCTACTDDEIASSDVAVGRVTLRTVDIHTRTTNGVQTFSVTGTGAHGTWGAVSLTDADLSWDGSTATVRGAGTIGPFPATFDVSPLRGTLDLGGTVEATLPDGMQLNATVELDASGTSSLSGTLLWGSIPIPISAHSSVDQSSGLVVTLTAGPDFALSSSVVVRNATLSLVDGTVTLDGALTVLGRADVDVHGTLSLTSGVPTFDLTTTSSVSIDLGDPGVAELTGQLRVSGALGQPSTVTGTISLLRNTLDFSGALTVTDDGLFHLALTNTPASSAPLALDLTYDSSANHLTGNVTIGAVSVGGINFRNLNGTLDLSPAAANFSFQGMATGQVGPIVLTNAAIGWDQSSLSILGYAQLGAATAGLAVTGPFALGPDGISYDLRGSFTAELPNAGTLNTTVEITSPGVATLNGTLDLPTDPATSIPVTGSVTVTDGQVTATLTTTSDVELGHDLTLHQVSLTFANGVLSVDASATALGRTDVAIHGTLTISGTALAFDLTVDAHTSFDLGSAGDAVIDGSLHLTGTTALPVQVDGRVQLLGNEIDFAGTLDFTDNQWRLSLHNTATSTATFSLDAAFDPMTDHLTGTLTASNIGFGSLSLTDASLSIDVSPAAATISLGTGTLTVDGFAVAVTGTLTVSDGSVSYHLTGQTTDAHLGPLTITEATITADNGTVRITGTAEIGAATGTLDVAGPVSLGPATNSFDLTGPLDITLPNGLGHISATLEITPDGATLTGTLSIAEGTDQLDLGFTGTIVIVDGAPRITMTTTGSIDLGSGLVLRNATVTYADGALTFAADAADVSLLDTHVAVSGRLTVTAAGIGFDITTAAQATIDLGGDRVVLAGGLHLAGTIGLDGTAAQAISVDGNLVFLDDTVAFAGTITDHDGIWHLELRQPSSSTTSLSLVADFDAAAQHLTGSVTIGKLTLGDLTLANVSVTVDIDPNTVTVTLVSAEIHIGDTFAITVSGTYTSPPECRHCIDVTGRATLTIAGHGSAELTIHVTGDTSGASLQVAGTINGSVYGATFATIPFTGTIGLSPLTVSISAAGDFSGSITLNQQTVQVVLHDPSFSVSADGGWTLAGCVSTRPSFSVPNSTSVVALDLDACGNFSSTGYDVSGPASFTVSDTSGGTTTRLVSGSGRASLRNGKVAFDDVDVTGHIPGLFDVAVSATAQFDVDNHHFSVASHDIDLAWHVGFDATVRAGAFSISDGNGLIFSVTNGAAAVSLPQQAFNVGASLAELNGTWAYGSGQPFSLSGKVLVSFGSGSGTADVTWDQNKLTISNLAVSDLFGLTVTGGSGFIDPASNVFNFQGSATLSLGPLANLSVHVDALDNSGIFFTSGTANVLNGIVELDNVTGSIPWHQSDEDPMVLSGDAKVDLGGVWVSVTIDSLTKTEIRFRDGAAVVLNGLLTLDHVSGIVDFDKGTYTLSGDATLQVGTFKVSVNLGALTLQGASISGGSLGNLNPSLDVSDIGGTINWADGTYDLSATVTLHLAGTTTNVVVDHLTPDGVAFHGGDVPEWDQRVNVSGIRGVIHWADGGSFDITGEVEINVDGFWTDVTVDHLTQDGVAFHGGALDAWNGKVELTDLNGVIWWAGGGGFDISAGVILHLGSATITVTVDQVTQDGVWFHDGRLDWRGLQLWNVAGAIMWSEGTFHLSGDAALTVGTYQASVVVDDLTQDGIQFHGGYLQDSADLVHVDDLNGEISWANDGWFDLSGDVSIKIAGIREHATLDHLRPTDIAISGAELLNWNADVSISNVSGSIDWTKGTYTLSGDVSVNLFGTWSMGAHVSELTPDGIAFDSAWAYVFGGAVQLSGVYGWISFGDDGWFSVTGDIDATMWGADLHITSATIATNWISVGSASLSLYAGVYINAVEMAGSIDSSGNFYLSGWMSFSIGSVSGGGHIDLLTNDNLWFSSGWLYASMDMGALTNISVDASNITGTLQPGWFDFSADVTISLNFGFEFFEWPWPLEGDFYDIISFDVISFGASVNPYGFVLSFPSISLFDGLVDTGTIYVGVTPWSAGACADIGFWAPWGRVGDIPVSIGDPSAC